MCTLQTTQSLPFSFFIQVKVLNVLPQLQYVKEKKKPHTRRKSPYMPDIVKKSNESNVACRSCILFLFLKGPVRGWSSLPLITEALQSCACSSSSSCLLLLLVLSEQSCLQPSAPVLHGMQKRLLLTTLLDTINFCLLVLI